MRERLRHIQGVIEAFEAERWQLDPTEPGGRRELREAR
jgi:hypothetical protein